MTLPDYTKPSRPVPNSEIRSVPNKVEVVANYRCDIGENPLWHPLHQKLYWTDIGTGRLFRYDPVSHHHEQCYSGRPVGGFTFQEDGSLLLFLDRGSVAGWRPGETPSILLEVEAERSTRFNDVFADPSGRVFCGTMSTPERKGCLYRIEPDLTFALILSDIGCSNGMALSLDQRTFYYTDSFARIIYAFDYEAVTGALSHQRNLVQFSERDGLPDGITLNSEGDLWVALWDGGRIVRISPDGRRLEELLLPTQKVSSVAFGGQDYDDLFITTAGGQDKPDAEDLAGALFRCQGLVRGLPDFFSKVRPRSNLKD